MASHIILEETSFDDDETWKGLCIFQYIHDLQPGASKDLVRDPDHSLLQVRNSQLLCLHCFWRATVLPILPLPQRAISYCKIIVFGKASENVSLPMMITVFGPRLRHVEYVIELNWVRSYQGQFRWIGQA
ncbi:hypothetical protein CGMCC3_g1723 [Colletotrichum fructicola]|uniref:Uncharacterized protein n=1 Tax=Colletotrichum fructicola (strain Nara gc5) TaxID=1213859 RepID=A0A7J6J661_COLFN|nr:uncharacterized protein CGMCC3_g1723 [Colletotrichum fructicola]KAE9582580.1 hypothetical protein CGMCC3_g1723 [Colletotrichum fructicola]KAF4483988.1 hypothetical protein CGGC5_v008444 [Colletotrichum fructicola Nara gc5]